MHIFDTKTMDSINSLKQLENHIDFNVIIKVFVMKICIKKLLFKYKLENKDYSEITIHVNSDIHSKMSMNY